MVVTHSLTILDHYAQKLFWFFWAVAVTVYSWTHLGQPRISFVQHLLIWVEILGFTLLVAVPALRALFSDMIPSQAAYVVWFGRFLYRFSQRLALLSFGILVLSWVGDRLYREAIHHPQNFLLFVLALYIVDILNRLMRNPASPSRRDQFDPLIDYALTRPTLSEQDVVLVAAHEAGHALVFAALGQAYLPSTFRVQVRYRMNEAGSLGAVSAYVDGNLLQERVFAEWFMMVLLAGQIGEALLCGKYTLGSTSDNNQWIHEAKTVLSGQYYGLFYTDPQNAFEHSHNQQMLLDLHGAQSQTLRQFFQMNADVHQVLAETLRASRTLSREALLPLLEKVRFPEGFPLPYGTPEF